MSNDLASIMQSSDLVELGLDEDTLAVAGEQQKVTNAFRLKGACSVKLLAVKSKVLTQTFL